MSGLNTSLNYRDNAHSSFSSGGGNSNTAENRDALFSRAHKNFSGDNQLSSGSPGFRGEPSSVAKVPESVEVIAYRATSNYFARVLNLPQDSDGRLRVDKENVFRHFDWKNERVADMTVDSIFDDVISQVAAERSRRGQSSRGNVKAHADLTASKFSASKGDYNSRLDQMVQSIGGPELLEALRKASELITSQMDEDEEDSDSDISSPNMRAPDMPPAPSVPTSARPVIGSAKAAGASQGSSKAGASSGASSASSAEAQAAQEKIAKALESGGDDLVSLSENDELMKHASEEQKSEMIAKLQEHSDKKGKCDSRPEGNKADRAIANVMQSANDKSEFDNLMKAHGGQELLHSVEYGEAKQSLVQAAAAWGSNEFIDEKHQEKYSKEIAASQDLFLNPPDKSSKIQPPAVGSYGSDPTATGLERVESETNAYIADQAYTNLSPRAQREMLLMNAQRASEGKEAVDNTEVISEVERLRSRTLAQIEAGDEDSYKEQWEAWKQGLERIRKEHDMSEDAFRHTVTSRYENFYLGTNVSFGEPDSGEKDERSNEEKYHSYTRDEADLEQLREKYGQAPASAINGLDASSSLGATGVAGQAAQEELHKLLQEYEQAVAEEGFESRRAETLRQEIADLEESSSEYTADLNKIGVELDTLYQPPPADTFWLKFTEVFLAVAELAMTLAAAAFLGPAGVALISAGWAIYHATQKDWMAMAGSLAGGAVGGMGAASGAIAKSAAKGSQTGATLARGIGSKAATSTTKAAATTGAKSASSFSQNVSNLVAKTGKAGQFMGLNPSDDVLITTGKLTNMSQTTFETSYAASQGDALGAASSSLGLSQEGMNARRLTRLTQNSATAAVTTTYTVQAGQKFADGNYEGTFDLIGGVSNVGNLSGSNEHFKAGIGGVNEGLPTIDYSRSGNSDTLPNSADPEKQPLLGGSEQDTDALDTADETQRTEATEEAERVRIAEEVEQTRLTGRSSQVQVEQMLEDTLGADVAKNVDAYYDPTLPEGQVRFASDPDQDGKLTLQYGPKTNEQTLQWHADYLNQVHESGEQPGLGLAEGEPASAESIQGLELGKYNALIAQAEAVMFDDTGKYSEVEKSLARENYAVYKQAQTEQRVLFGDAEIADQDDTLPQELLDYERLIDDDIALLDDANASASVKTQAMNKLLAGKEQLLNLLKQGGEAVYQRVLPLLKRINEAVRSEVDALLKRFGKSDTGEDTTALPLLEGDFETSDAEVEVASAVLEDTSGTHSPQEKSQAMQHLLRYEQALENLVSRGQSFVSESAQALAGKVNTALQNGYQTLVKLEQKLNPRAGGAEDVADAEMPDAATEPGNDFSVPQAEESSATDLPDWFTDIDEDGTFAFPEMKESSLDAPDRFPDSGSIEDKNASIEQLIEETLGADVAKGIEVSYNPMLEGGQVRYTPDRGKDGKLVLSYGKDANAQNIQWHVEHLDTLLQYNDNAGIGEKGKGYIPELYTPEAITQLEFDKHEKLIEKAQAVIADDTGKYTAADAAMALDNLAIYEAEQAEIIKRISSRGKHPEQRDVDGRRQVAAGGEGISASSSLGTEQRIEEPDFKRIDNESAMLKDAGGANIVKRILNGESNIRITDEALSDSLVNDEYNEMNTKFLEALKEVAGNEVGKKLLYELESYQGKHEAEIMFFPGTNNAQVFLQAIEGKFAKKYKKHPMHDIPEESIHDFMRNSEVAKQALEDVYTLGKGASAIVAFDPFIDSKFQDGLIPRDVTLFHELVHVLHFFQGSIKGGMKYQSTDLEEYSTVGAGPYLDEFTENNYRVNRNEDTPLRERYIDYFFGSKDSEAVVTKKVEELYQNDPNLNEAILERVKFEYDSEMVENGVEYSFPTEETDDIVFSYGPSSNWMNLEFYARHLDVLGKYSNQQSNADGMIPAIDDDYGAQFQVESDLYTKLIEYAEGVKQNPKNRLEEFVAASNLAMYEDRLGQLNQMLSGNIDFQFDDKRVIGRAIYAKDEQMITKRRARNPSLEEGASESRRSRQMSAEAFHNRNSGDVSLAPEERERIQQLSTQDILNEFETSDSIEGRKQLIQSLTPQQLSSVLGDVNDGARKDFTQLIIDSTSRKQKEGIVQDADSMIYNDNLVHCFDASSVVELFTWNRDRDFLSRLAENLSSDQFKNFVMDESVSNDLKFYVNKSLTSTQLNEMLKDSNYSDPLMGAVIQQLDREQVNDFILSQNIEKEVKDKFSSKMPDEQLDELLSSNAISIQSKGEVMNALQPQQLEAFFSAEYIDFRLQREMVAELGEEQLLNVFKPESNHSDEVKQLVVQALSTKQLDNVLSSDELPGDDRLEIAKSLTTPQELSALKNPNIGDVTKIFLIAGMSTNDIEAVLRETRIPEASKEYIVAELSTKQQVDVLRSKTIDKKTKEDFLGLLEEVGKIRYDSKIKPPGEVHYSVDANEDGIIVSYGSEANVQNIQWHFEHLDTLLQYNDNAGIGEKGKGYIPKLDTPEAITQLEFDKHEKLIEKALAVIKDTGNLYSESEKAMAQENLDIYRDEQEQIVERIWNEKYPEPLDSVGRRKVAAGGGAAGRLMRAEDLEDAAHAGEGNAGNVFIPGAGGANEPESNAGNVFIPGDGGANEPESNAGNVFIPGAGGANEPESNAGNVFIPGDGGANEPESNVTRVFTPEDNDVASNVEDSDSDKILGLMVSNLNSDVNQHREGEGLVRGIPAEDLPAIYTHDSLKEDAKSFIRKNVDSGGLVALLSSDEIDAEHKENEIIRDLSTQQLAEVFEDTLNEVPQGMKRDIARNITDEQLSELLSSINENQLRVVANALFDAEVTGRILNSPDGVVSRNDKIEFVRYLSPERILKSSNHRYENSNRFILEHMSNEQLNGVYLNESRTVHSDDKYRVFRALTLEQQNRFFEAPEELVSAEAKKKAVQSIPEGDQLTSSLLVESDNVVSGRAKQAYLDRIDFKVKMRLFKDGGYEEFINLRGGGRDDAAYHRVAEYIANHMHASEIAHAFDKHEDINNAVVGNEVFREVDNVNSSGRKSLLKHMSAERISEVLNALNTSIAQQLKVRIINETLSADQRSIPTEKKVQVVRSLDQASITAFLGDDNIAGGEKYMLMRRITSAQLKDVFMAPQNEVSGAIKQKVAKNISSVQLKEIFEYLGTQPGVSQNDKQAIFGALADAGVSYRVMNSTNDDVSKDSKDAYIRSLPHTSVVAFLNENEVNSQIKGDSVRKLSRIQLMDLFTAPSTEVPDKVKENIANIITSKQANNLFEYQRTRPSLSQNDRQAIFSALAVAGASHKVMNSPNNEISNDEKVTFIRNLPYTSVARLLNEEEISGQTKKSSLLRLSRIQLRDVLVAPPSEVPDDIKQRIAMTISPNQINKLFDYLRTQPSGQENNTRAIVDVMARAGATERVLNDPDNKISQANQDLFLRNRG